MTYASTFTKSATNGSSVKTSIPLGDVNADGELTLKITTSKRHNGLLTSHASVCRSKSENGFRVEAFVIFQDFSRTVSTSPRGTRATEKNLRALHEEGLSFVPCILEIVRAQYGLTL